MPFLNGFLLGLGMIVFIGPVFIQLLTISIRYGIRSGLSLAFGIFVSDIFCVIICRYGNKLIILSNDLKIIFSLAGSFLLFILGLKTFFKESVTTKTKYDHHLRNLISAFGKGFIVNFINPFVFLVWMGVIVYSNSEYGSSVSEIIYLSGVLLGILTLDITKVFLAKEISKYLSGSSHSWIIKICGLVLIGFSIRLLVIVLDN